MKEHIFLPKSIHLNIAIFNIILIVAMIYFVFFILSTQIANFVLTKTTFDENIETVLANYDQEIKQLIRFEEKTAFTVKICDKALFENEKILIFVDPCTILIVEEAENKTTIYRLNLRIFSSASFYRSKL